MKKHCLEGGLKTHKEYLILQSIDISPWRHYILYDTYNEVHTYSYSTEKKILESKDRIVEDLRLELELKTDFPDIEYRGDELASILKNYEVMLELNFNELNTKYVEKNYPELLL